MRFDSLREELFLLSAQAIFCRLLFFVEITFHTKKQINGTFAICYCTPPPPPRPTMSSPVITVMEGMKEKKQIKTEIGLWSIVKAKDG